MIRCKKGQKECEFCTNTDGGQKCGYYKYKGVALYSDYTDNLYLCPIYYEQIQNNESKSKNGKK